MIINLYICEKFMSNAPCPFYFTPSEFLKSPIASRLGIDNSPCDWIVYRNLFYLAVYLDSVRSRLGKPIMLTSVYRSSILNKAVGGVNNSKHLLGLAVDISILQFADYEKLRQIIGNDCRFIKYYPEKGYMHVDFTQEFLTNHFNTSYEK